MDTSLERTTAAFACAIVCGWYGFSFFFDDPNPKVPLLAGIIAGFGGSWAVMKIWSIICRAVLREDAGRSKPPPVHDSTEARYLPGVPDRESR
jgi:hypothetical protein